jgi:iron(III) transport system permease protein
MHARQKPSASVPVAKHHPMDIATIAPHLVWWGTIALLAFVVFYPSVVLILNSFKADGEFTLANYARLFQDPKIYTSMFNSLKVVVPSTLIGTAIGVVLAWIVARTDLPGKKIWQVLIAIPYLIPPFIGAISWTYLLGPVGWFNKWYMELFHATSPLIDIYSLGGMIFVMSIYGYTIPYIVVLPAIKMIDASVEEAGRISGASTLRTMKDITIPLLLPAIMGGMLLLFMNLLADFGIPAVLGAPKQIHLMTTQIYVTILNTDLSNNLQIASAYSMLLAAFGIIGLQLYQRMVKSSKYIVVSGKSPSAELTKLGKWKLPVSIVLGVLVFLAAFAPIAAAFFTSLIRAYGAPITWANLTFNNYVKLFNIESIQRAMTNSFTLSAASGIVIAFLGLIIAYMIIRMNKRGSRLVEGLIAVPYAVPGTIVALSMILAFLNPIPVINLALYNTYWILFIAYLARFMNLGLQTLSGAVSQIHPSLEEASRISGATPMRAFWDIMLPLLRPSFYAAFFLVMIPALGEITLSSLLWSVGNETIGVLVFSMQEEGKVTLTAAMASILIAAVFLLNTIVKIVSKGKMGI